MSIRHTTTPAFSLVAGLTIVSSGMVGVLLARSPSTNQTTVKSCSIQVTASQARSGQSGLKLRTQSFSVEPMGGALLADTATASPSPTGSDTATATTDPGTTSSSSPSPTPSPTLSSSTPTSPPPTSASPTPTGSGTPTTSPATPSPTASTAQPPSALLCLSIQSLNSRRVVRPGGHARYAIWVWLTDGKGGSAKVQLSTKPRRFASHFTVCQPQGRSTCAVGGLDAGQKVQLRAMIPVPKHAANARITLTVTAHSPEAAHGVSAKFSMWVRAHKSKHAAAHGRSHSQPTAPGIPGVGISLPNGLSLQQLSQLGQLSPGVSPGSLPALPAPVSNPGSAFPQVSPSPSPSAAVLPPARAIPAADVSATRPLELRLVGGQIVGLALLAAAVIILLARLAVRRRRPRHSKHAA
jgi:hypothetical protein